MDIIIPLAGEKDAMMCTATKIKQNLALHMPIQDDRGEN
jgi:hypothetical protein